MAAPAAILLAGGSSRRMGADKATLVVDGVRLIDRLIEEVARAGITRVVVAGPDPGGLPATVTVAPDHDADRRGPLAGLSAAWRSLSATELEAPDPIVVLSCDLVRVDRAVIEALVEAAAGHPVGAMADDGERLQPLVAAYRRSTIAGLHDAFHRGARSISDELVASAPARVAFEPELLVDADTPADLAGRDVQWPGPGERSPIRRSPGE